jgi:hypothetical protein
LEENSKNRKSETTLAPDLTDGLNSGNLWRRLALQRTIEN